MEELYQIEDLTPVFMGSDNLVLFVRTEDLDNLDNCLAIKINTSTRQYYIDLLQRFLKFSPYEEVTRDDLVTFYFRQKVYSSLSDETLVHLVTDFTESIQKWESLENKFNYE